ncbi:MAG: hypothetical protein PVH25_05445 [Burkholderiales bacterium]|jgi:hypothetical protein
MPMMLTSIHSARRHFHYFAGVAAILVLIVTLPTTFAGQSAELDRPPGGTGMYSTYVDTRTPFVGEELADTYPIPMDDLVPALLLTIDHLSKYKMPHELPVVHRAPHEKIEQLACGKPCAALAAYRSGEGIFIDEALKPETEIFARSVLLHELVHYLQDVSRELESLRLCERWYRREQEAYAIQKRFLVLVGSQIRVAYSAGSSCDNDNG